MDEYRQRTGDSLRRANTRVCWECGVRLHESRWISQRDGEWVILTCPECQHSFRTALSDPDYPDFD